MIQRIALWALIALPLFAMVAPPYADPSFDPDAWEGFSSFSLPEHPASPTLRPSPAQRVEPGSAPLAWPEHTTQTDLWMEAVRGVESSYGADCTTSRAGAVGCWQVLESTAKLYGCGRPDTAACARRIVQAGAALCGPTLRAVSHWYYWGRCGGYGKSTWYTMRVIDAMHDVRGAIIRNKRA